MARDRPAAMGAQRVLEQRVDVGRHLRVVALLESRCCPSASSPTVSGVPASAQSSLTPARRAICRPCIASAPAIRARRTSPRGDAVGGLVDPPLRRVAAHAGVDAVRAASMPSRRRGSCRRIGVGARDDVDHRELVDVAEVSADAGVVGRAARRHRHHLERFHHLARIGGAIGELADPDDDRLASVIGPRREWRTGGGAPSPPLAPMPSPPRRRGCTCSAKSRWRRRSRRRRRCWPRCGRRASSA